MSPQVKLPPSLNAQNLELAYLDFRRLLIIAHPSFRLLSSRICRQDLAYGPVTRDSRVTDVLGPRAVLSFSE